MINMSNIKQNSGTASQPSAVIDRNALVLETSLSLPLRMDRSIVRSGEVLFAFVIKSGILFFLLQIGSSFLLRVPYTRIAQGGQADIGSLSELHLRLLDAADGDILRYSSYRLPKDVATRLREILYAMSEQEEVSAERFYRRLDIAYASYTAVDMMRDVGDGCMCVFRRDGSFQVGRP